MSKDDARRPKSQIPRPSYLSQQSAPLPQRNWNPGTHNFRAMAHDSPLYAKKAAPLEKNRVFFGEQDTSYLRPSGALMPSRIPGLSSSELTSKTLPADQAAVASAVHDGDIILSNKPLLQRSRTLPPALKASDLASPSVSTSSEISSSPQAPKTPSGVLPDEGLTASQKVRIGLSGLLLTSEAFRNSTGINSSGRTRRNASPGQTRALNLSQAPISPAHSRTSSQGSSRSVRTEALVAKLIPTKNSVHSLIGYIKELQSSEASLRTHLDTIKTKAQEDLDASYDKVNDLEKSMRQIETERQRNAMELEKKAREIDELQKKIQELRKAIEKIPPSVLSQLEESTQVDSLLDEQDSLPSESPQLSPTESEGGMFTQEIPLSTPPSFEQMLVEFYELWEPAKMKNVPMLARQYSGNERALVDELEKKYGADAVGPLDAVYPKELSRSTSEVDSELVPEDSAPSTPHTPFIMTSETFMNETTIKTTESQPTSQKSPSKPTTLTIVTSASFESDQPENEQYRSAEVIPRVLTSCLPQSQPSSPRNSSPAQKINNVNQMNIEDSNPSMLHEAFVNESPNMKNPAPPVQSPEVVQNDQIPKPLPTEVAPRNLSPPQHPPLSSPPLSRGLPPMASPPRSRGLPPEPLSRGLPPLAKAPPTLTQLLTDFYKTYQPDKLKEVKQIVKKYTGKERVLVELLKTKYGARSVQTLEANIGLIDKTSVSSTSPNAPHHPLVRVLSGLTCLCLGALAWSNVASYMDCTSSTPVSAAYCAQWEEKSQAFWQTMDISSAWNVVTLATESQSTVASVSRQVLHRSWVRTCHALDNVSILHDAMPQMLKDCAHALELLMQGPPDIPAEIVLPSGETLRKDTTDASMYVFNVALNSAEDEAAKLMQWV